MEGTMKSRIFFLIGLILFTGFFLISGSLAQDAGIYEDQHSNSSDTWIYKKWVMYNQAVDDTLERVQVEYDTEGKKKISYSWPGSDFKLSNYLDEETPEIIIIFKKNGSFDSHIPMAIAKAFNTGEVKKKNKARIQVYEESEGSGGSNILLDSDEIDLEISQKSSENISVEAGNFQDCIKLGIFGQTELRKTGTMNIVLRIWLKKEEGVVKQASDFTIKSDNNSLIAMEEYELLYANIGNKEYGAKPEGF